MIITPEKKYKYLREIIECRVDVGVSFPYASPTRSIPYEVVQSKNLELLTMAPLNYLDLTANKIDTVPKEITVLSDRLSSLYLGGNQLQTISTVEIIKMQKLRMLDMGCNRISSSEIARLKSIFASNPNTIVLYGILCIEFSYGFDIECLQVFLAEYLRSSEAV